MRFKRNGNHKLIGKCETSTQSLLTSTKQTIPLSGGMEGVSITVDECHFVPKASFFQFVQSGLDINFMVAIDYTASNGPPTNPNSLHYYNPSGFAAGQYNQYEKIITLIGKVIEVYDSDSMFPVYGFGAKLPGTTSSNHCFPLTLNANPEVSGVNGIMDVYHNVLSKVSLLGPTLFSPVISQAMR